MKTQKIEKNVIFYFFSKKWGNNHFMQKEIQVILNRIGWYR